MRRWPPLLWLPVYVASELILLGSHRRWDLLAPGIALALLAFVLALRWALGREQGRPRPRWFVWAIGAVAVFYVISATAAALAGPQYVVAALLAGVIPITALALALATARHTTDDSLPTLPLDEETPFGDTREHAKEIREQPPRRVRR